MFSIISLHEICAYGATAVKYKHRAFTDAVTCDKCVNSKNGYKWCQFEGFGYKVIYSNHYNHTFTYNYTEFELDDKFANDSQSSDDKILDIISDRKHRRSLFSFCTYQDSQCPTALFGNNFHLFNRSTQCPTVAVMQGSYQPLINHDYSNMSDWIKWELRFLLFPWLYFFLSLFVYCLFWCLLLFNLETDKDLAESLSSKSICCKCYNVIISLLFLIVMILPYLPVTIIGYCLCFIYQFIFNQKIGVLDWNDNTNNTKHSDEKTAVEIQVVNVDTVPLQKQEIRIQTDKSRVNDHDRKDNTSYSYSSSCSWMWVNVAYFLIPYMCLCIATIVEFFMPLIIKNYELLLLNDTFHVAIVFFEVVNILVVLIGLIAMTQLFKFCVDQRSAPPGIYVWNLLNLIIVVSLWVLIGIWCYFVIASHFTDAYNDDNVDLFLQVGWFVNYTLFVFWGIVSAILYYVGCCYMNMWMIKDVCITFWKGIIQHSVVHV